MRLAAPPPGSLGARRPRAFVAAHPDALALGIVVLAATLIRVTFAFRTPVFLLRDSASYFLPAWDLVNGLGFDLSVRRTPAYPLFLAGSIGLLGEELLAIAFAQHLLGIVMVVLVYWLGRVTFGRAAGVLAGLLTGLNGALLISEHYVMPETLMIVLLLATLLAATLAIQRGSRPLFLASGALLGLCILCKPAAQIVVPVIPLVALVALRSPRRVVVPTALFGAGLALVLVPWVVRNWAVHGSATTAGALGQTLIARTAKHDRGFDWYDARQAGSYERREGIARQIVENGIRQRLSDGEIYRRVQDRFGMTDPEVNGFMRDLATRVILAQPIYYLQGTASMTWQLLLGEVEKLSTDWKTQNARLSRDEWEDRVEHLLSRASTAQRNEADRAAMVADLFQPARLGPLLPLLALLGTVAGIVRPRLRPSLLLGLTTLAMLGVTAALDGPVIRYRYPTDPLVAIAAAGGATWALGAAWSWVSLRARSRGLRAGRAGAHAPGVPALSGSQVPASSASPSPDTRAPAAPVPTSPRAVAPARGAAEGA